MKNEIKTIIIGIAITILLVFLTLFIFYKIDQNKNRENIQTSTSDNETLKNEPYIENNKDTQNKNETINENKEDSDKNETTEAVSNSSDDTNSSDNEKETKVTLYLFHGDNCPACKNAIAKIKETKSTTYQNVDIKTYEVWSNEENQALMKKVAEKLNVEVRGVPFFVIGSESVIGYNEEKILKNINNANNDKNYQDIVAKAIKENTNLNPEMGTIK